MTDIYQNWRDRLAGKDVPVHADQPDPGYYKVRAGRDGPWQPCAIWYRGDELVCRVGDATRDPLATWTYAVKNPVAKDAAKFAFENGHFPDEAKPVALSNMPADPFDALLAEIEDKSAQASDLLAKDVKTQTECDLFRNVQAQLLALNKRADAMHKEEKAPHLEKARAVDDRFRFRDKVADIAARLRSKFEVFLRSEERRQREAAQREFEAKQAAVKAEQDRIAAAFVAKVRDDPVAALTDPEPIVLPEMPTAPEPVKVSAGGGFGRKAGLKSVWVATLSDIDAALAHYKDNAKVRDLVQKLADADVRSGKRAVPGFAVTEERKAA